MIVTKKFALTNDKLCVSICDVQISMTCSPPIAEREASVEFSVGYAHFLEPDFAEQRYDVGEQRLLPVVEMACVESSKSSLLILLGLREWVVLDLKVSKIVARLCPYRKRSDDTGFYEIQLLELPQGVVTIYEGGVALISNLGTLCWHVRKLWDDIFVGQIDDQLKFMREGNNSNFLISLATGEVS